MEMFASLIAVCSSETTLSFTDVSSGKAYQMNSFQK